LLYINREANRRTRSRRGEREDCEAETDFPAREAEASDRYEPPRSESLGWNQPSDQNDPVKPTLSKISRASSAAGRRKSGSSRSPYHFCDSAHACGSVIVAPRSTPRDWHQRVMSSSDRKSRMFAHV